MRSEQIKIEKIIFLRERISYRRNKYMQSINHCTKLILVGASETELVNRFELVASKGNLWLIVFETVRNNSNLTYLLCHKYINSRKFDIEQSMLITSQLIEDGHNESALLLIQNLLSGRMKARSL